MLRRNSAFAAIAFAVSILAAFDASATAQRTFVASTGNDANPCSLALPCRTFSAAIGQTIAGGEVIVLDSGGYGPVTITQSVSIIAPPGVFAGISVFSGDGIAIDAGIDDVVSLRNITITGLGGAHGINAQGNRYELRIAEVHISGFVYINVPASGLLFAASDATLTVTHSEFHDNYNGIEITPPTLTTASVVVADTLLTGNSGGYVQSGPGNTRATVTRTTASANSAGFAIVGLQSATNTLAIEGCVMANNGFGIETETGTFVVSNSTLARNTNYGIYVQGAGDTRKNNTFWLNGTDVSGTLNTVPGS